MRISRPSPHAVLTTTGVLFLAAAGVGLAVRTLPDQAAGPRDAGLTSATAVGGVDASDPLIDHKVAVRVPTSTSTVYSLAMHMHGSISEGDGNYAWMSSNALTNHIDVLWWTDHDVFYYPDGAPDVAGFDFEAGGKTAFVTGWPSTDSVYVAWTMDDSEATPPAAYDFKVNALYAHSGSYGGRVQATASATGVNERLTYYIDVSPRFQFKSLMGDVNMSFWVKPFTTSADGELQVTVPLSAAHAGETYTGNDNHKSIVFYHGAVSHPALSDDGNTIWVPITAGTNEWVQVNANLTDLATEAWGDAVARDLHGEMITIREVVSNGASIKYDLDDFEWSMTHTGDDLRTLQAEYLSTLGTSPVQLLGQEVSEVSPGHLNVYGGGVPVMPYAASDTWDGNSVADWVHGFGGIVSYNHMFGVSDNRDDDATRAANVASRIAEIEANAMWGADLLEVGYRQRNGLLSDFLTVWDEIGMSGLYKTGIGAFDLHDNLEMSTFTNNLVTFVPLTTAFSESAIITELKKGNSYFGDPTYFTNGHVTATLTTTSPASKMGNVVIGVKSAINVTFALSQVPAGTTVSLVEDGVVTKSWSYTASKRISIAASINPVGGNVVRFQVTTSGGNAVLYTNPIYFIDTDPGTIPSDRKVVARPPR